MPGAASYRKGANLERLVKKAYEDAGWVATRTPQSGSPFDLMCAKDAAQPDACNCDVFLPRPMVHLVQVKTGGYMRPPERIDLIEVAKKAGALPVLAWGKKPVQRKNVHTGEEMQPLG